ncbi:MAG: TlpA family protein disulfide reductase [Dehalococcoidia bacterium]
MATNSLSAKQSPWFNPLWSGKVWIMVAFMLIPTLGFAIWVASQAGGQTKVDPEILAIARANSGTTVTAITGTEHTVYHSGDPIPEAKAHRTDGKLTLVWFTKTTCSSCEDELFVHGVMQDFRDDVAFMEKDVSREAAAKRLNVTDVPTFIWIDSEGNELGRFTDAGNEASFRADVREFVDTHR